MTYLSFIVSKRPLTSFVEKPFDVQRDVSTTAGQIATARRSLLNPSVLFCECIRGHFCVSFSPFFVWNKPRQGKSGQARLSNPDQGAGTALAYPDHEVNYSSRKPGRQYKRKLLSTLTVCHILWLVYSPIIKYIHKDCQILTNDRVTLTVSKREVCNRVYISATVTHINPQNIN